MVSLSFSNPEFFALLLLIPVLMYSHRLFYKVTKKHALIFSNFETLKRVRKDTKMRAHILVFISRIFVFILLILVLVGPLIHYSAERQPTDYVLAIDTSASMSATDFQPNRFEAAKQLAITFTEGFDNEIALGVMGFSGYTEVMSPLTNNTGEVTASVRQLKIQPVSGTDIAGAITTGTNLLIGSDKGRALVLITDGSATTGQATTDPIARALSYARNYQVTIHTIGIGDPGAAPTGYLPTLYNVSAVYDEEQLMRITNETNGEFLRAQNSQELLQALQLLREDPESTNAVYDPKTLLLVLALVLIFIEWVVMNSRLRIIP